MNGTSDPIHDVHRALATLVGSGQLSRRQSERLQSELNESLQVASRQHSSLAAFVDGLLMALDAGSLVEGTHFARLPGGELALALRETWSVVGKSMVSHEQRSSARLFLRETAARRLGVVAYQARARFAGRRRRVLLLNVEVARKALNRPAVPV